jgi:acetyl esterase/lipase
VQARDAVVSEGLVIDDVDVPSSDGATIEMSIVRRPEASNGQPLLYFIHGGGMMLGTRWSGHEEFIKCIERYDAIVATIEYRLAPEHRFPRPHEDCYSGLLWLERNAPSLGVQIDRSLIFGTSAGGGLAAAVALMARDREGPTVGGVMLLAPMLDDRPSWPSWQQFPTGVWNASENQLAWNALLGEETRRADVSHHAVPGRTQDFRELPTTYVEVGSAELFRDESVAFASGIWAAGGRAELHVWDGGFHGFDSHAHTALAQGAAQARFNWMDRVLGLPARRSD